MILFKTCSTHTEWKRNLYALKTESPKKNYFISNFQEFLNPFLFTLSMSMLSIFFILKKVKFFIKPKFKLLIWHSIYKLIHSIFN